MLGIENPNYKFSWLFPTLGVYAIANLLDYNETLEHLSLANNSISDLECKVLCHAFENNTTLTSLSLRNNCLTEKSIDNLCSVLEYNVLRVLDISRNKFGPETLSQLFVILGRYEL